MDESTRLLEFVESDGLPMGETELHIDQIIYLRQALDLLARVRREDPTVHVGGNLLFYYDPMDPKKHLSPDVFLVRGLVEPRRQLRTYKLWEEGRGPDLVVEVASRDTYARDLGAKKELYREVFRVSEYVVFDPEHILEEGPLLAWRLVGRGYRRVGAPEQFESRVVPCTLQVLAGRLRLVDERGAVVPGDAAAGIEEGLRGAVLKVLETRFGPLPPRVAELVARLPGDRLERAVVLSASVTSPGGLLDALG